MILYRKFKDRIERNSFAGTCGWIIGGAKGYVGPPPSQIIGGGPGPPGPPPFFLRLCMVYFDVIDIACFDVVIGM